MMCRSLSAAITKENPKCVWLLSARKEHAWNIAAVFFNQSLHFFFLLFLFFVFLSRIAHTLGCTVRLFVRLFLRVVQMQKFNVNASAVRLQAYQDLNFFYIRFFFLHCLRHWKLSERSKIRGANLFNHFRWLARLKFNWRKFGLSLWFGFKISVHLTVIYCHSKFNISYGVIAFGYCHSAEIRCRSRSFWGNSVSKN